MSSQKGNTSRTRAQKYKNRTVFKNDLHDKTPQQKKLNALHVSEVCQHCKSVIEWKIKYKKYKALSQPKCCTKCQQRKIRKAYHVLCRDCALEARVCAKCLKSAEQVEIEPSQPTPEEEQKLKAEMERLIKSLPERKRRAFLRYMDKGKKLEVDEEQQEVSVSDDGDDDDDDSDKEEETPKPPPIRIPHSREELLKKIEQLTLKEYDDNDNDEEDDDEEDDCSDDDSIH